MWLNMFGQLEVEFLSNVWVLLFRMRREYFRSIKSMWAQLRFDIIIVDSTDFGAAQPLFEEHFHRQLRQLMAKIAVLVWNPAVCQHNMRPHIMIICAAIKHHHVVRVAIDGHRFCHRWSTSLPCRGSWSRCKEVWRGNDASFALCECFKSISQRTPQAQDGAVCLHFDSRGSKRKQGDFSSVKDLSWSGHYCFAICSNSVDALETGRETCC